MLHRYMTRKVLLLTGLRNVGYLRGVLQIWSAVTLAVLGLLT